MKIVFFGLISLIGVMALGQEKSLSESVFAPLLTATRTLNCTTENSNAAVKLKLEVKGEMASITIITSSDRQPSQVQESGPQVLVGQDVADDLAKTGNAAIAFPAEPKASLSLRNGSGFLALSGTRDDSEQILAISNCH